MRQSRCHVRVIAGLLTLICFAMVGGTGQTAGVRENRLDLAELRRPMVNPREMPLYTLHMEPEFPSTWQIGRGDAPPIPAGFFGKGSDPWVGPISCVGIPLDPKGAAPTADLVVQHEAIEWIPNPEKRFGPREIPKNYRLRCQMLKLHERAVEPLVVTYDHGKRSEKWNVEVTLAKNHPGGGMIEITRISPDGNGGYADIEIAVKVDFTFREESTGRVVTFTSGVEWLSETDHEFTRWADPATLAQFHIPPSAQGSFIPASRSSGGRIEPLGKCSKNTRVAHSFTLAPTLETIANVPHGTLPQVRQYAPRSE